MQRSIEGAPGGARARARLGAGAAAALLCCAAGVRAEPADWRDFESRIQYAYYVEDGRALEVVAAAVAQDESHDRLHGYYGALAAWRQAQLAQRRGGASAPFVQRCLQQLDALIDSQGDFAEALALRAACAQLPTGALRMPFAHRPRRDLDRALQLAPRNARVLFTDALDAGAAKPPANQNELPKLRQAVAAFELERAGTEPLPGWGAAEAYCELGRALLLHGDAVGARDALERALLLAPDYAEARRLMAKIAHG